MLLDMEKTRGNMLARIRPSSVGGSGGVPGCGGGGGGGGSSNDEIHRTTLWIFADMTHVDCSI